MNRDKNFQQIPIRTKLGEELRKIAIDNNPISKLNFDGLASAMEVIAKEAKDAGLTVEETEQALLFMGEQGIRGAKVGKSIRKALAKLTNTHQAVAIFSKTSDKYHTTSRSQEMTGEYYRKVHPAMEFHSAKKKGANGNGYWMHIGERKALDFIHLLIRQRCFPIKYRETDTEISIIYHFKSPVVELTSPIEVDK